MLRCVLGDRAQLSLILNAFFPRDISLVPGANLADMPVSLFVRARAGAAMTASRVTLVTGKCAGRWTKGNVMSVSVMREFLAWSTIINYGILIVWFLLFSFAHDWTYGQQAKWFRLSVERFDASNYLCFSLFKLGIVLFNLVPFLALSVVT